MTTTITTVPRIDDTGCTTAETWPLPLDEAWLEALFSADSREDGEGLRGGARLADALRSAKEADPRYAGIEVQEMPCLFTCSDYCTVHPGAPGKVSYVLGRFRPEEDAARAILDYAVHYAASEHGRVPVAHWPDGVKGHFITRSPPGGYVAE